MLQILGKATSINVRKVLWLCEELQLPYELQQWGSGPPGTDEPQVPALNPNALVPVIQDGAFVLWESNAICRYLAAAYPKNDLLPMNLQQRARVEQWMDWQATELNNSWRYAFSALVRRSAAHTDPQAVETSVSSWNRHMGLLDEHLRTSGPFVIGSRF